MDEDKRQVAQHLYHTIVQAVETAKADGVSEDTVDNILLGVLLHEVAPISDSL